MNVGQIIKGAKGTYELIKQLPSRAAASIPFKARILSSSDLPPSAEWAFVKTPSPSCDEASISFKREWDAYHRPDIAASSCIRAMYDIGDHTSSRPPCLVFEWMDSTLHELVSESYRRSPILHQAIMKSCLSGLDALRKEKIVHLNIKPSNILLSHIDTHSPIVKLGGLSKTRPDGYEDITIPFATRPPELFHTVSCTHKSDVWSLAAALFSWIEPGVFGLKNNRNEEYSRWVSISKLMRLFPIWAEEPDDYENMFAGSRSQIQEFEWAKGQHYGSGNGLRDSVHDEIFQVSPLEIEMKKMDIEPALRNMFRYLFVFDRSERPSAEKALASKQFEDLKEAAFAK